MRLVAWVLILIVGGNVAVGDAPTGKAPPASREEPPLKLISPYAAAFSSAILPGWGQFRTGHPIQGAVTAILLTGTLASGWISRSSYLDVYNNEYIPAAMVDPKSATARDAFNRANQRFKMSQFFFFTALGIWAYSVVDSYVGAHIYNAEQKAERLQSVSPVELKAESEGMRIVTRFHF